MLIALWIVSEFRRDFIHRSWTITRARPAPENPATTLIDHAFGGWTFSSEKGSLVLESADDLFTYDGQYPDEPVPSPLVVDWVHGSDRDRSNSELDFYPRFLGFAYFKPAIRASLIPPPRDTFFDRTVLVVPYWAPVLVTATAAILATLRNMRKIGTGLCLQCGYDLRASKERCPVCGRKIGT
jgi:hypothetical protein